MSHQLAFQIGAIGERLERMDTSFASFQALLEERLPPSQPEPIQKPPQAMQGGQTSQTPTNQPRQPIFEVQTGQGVPICVKARNAMPMRPPTLEVRAQPNQPRFGMPIGKPYERTLV